MHKKLTTLLASKPTRIVLLACLPLVAGIATWLVVDSLQTSPSSTNASQQIKTEAPAIRAALTVVDGTVEVKINDAWLPIKQGDTVETGQSVRTTSGARVVITTDDGNAFRLNENSELVLTKLAADTSKVDTVKGEVYGRIAPSDRSVTTQVGDTTVTSKGAAYRAVNTENTHGIEVYSQSVSVDSTDTTVNEGESYLSRDGAAAEVTPLTLNALADDEFLSWNIELDKQDTTYAKHLGVLDRIPSSTEASPGQSGTTPAPAAVAGFKLTGERTASGIRLNWTTNGVATANGYKLVYSTSNSQPTFGTDQSLYISQSETRSWLLPLKDGKTYYLRACTYVADTNNCSAYTNTVTVTAPQVTTGDNGTLQNGPIALTVNGTTLNWTVGGTAPRGFKVVMSHEGTPSYPNNSKAYLEDSSLRSVDLAGWKLDAGTYNIRLCKYTGEGCVDYSNQTTITIP